MVLRLGYAQLFRPAILDVDKIREREQQILLQE